MELAIKDLRPSNGRSIVDQVSDTNKNGRIKFPVNSQARLSNFNRRVKFFLPKSK